jgi:hypothetical protein
MFLAKLRETNSNRHFTPACSAGRRKPSVAGKKHTPCSKKVASCGMMKSPQSDAPSHLAVEDVDATAANARKLGGKIVVEPVDIPTVGCIAVLTDSKGAGHRPVQTGHVNQFNPKTPRSMGRRF